MQAAAINPTAQLYSQIGMIYEGLHAWDRSLDFLHRALQMDNAYEPTYVYLGNLYMETGNPPRRSLLSAKLPLSIPPMNMRDLPWKLRATAPPN